MTPFKDKRLSKEYFTGALKKIISSIKIENLKVKQSTNSNIFNQIFRFCFEVKFGIEIFDSILEAYTPVKGFSH